MFRATQWRLAALFASNFVIVACTTDVFAHFMVQNSWAYNEEQWKQDMLSAQSVGIDAFAMNWMPPDCQDNLQWQESRIGDAYKVAEEVGFKIVHSFDMSWAKCSVYWNATYMADILQRHANSSATYHWNDSMLVTTYGGDSVIQYGNSFFEDLKAKMASYDNPISLAPALTRYSTKAQIQAVEAASEMIRDFPTADGYLNWQAWPMEDHVNNTFIADNAFQRALQSSGRTGPYIMAVSPWQFKDLDDGSEMDAWVAPSDWLFVKRLQALAQGDIRPDIIELLTWNDWCESHYLRDLPGNSTSSPDYAVLGTMKSYVAGQNHSPWRVIATYYLTWWKTGNKPYVSQDQVVYWYRIHKKNAQCDYGSALIRNSNMLEDAVFTWATVAKDSIISMAIGNNERFEFPARASSPATGSVPFPADLGDSGLRPTIAVIQNNKTAYQSIGPKPITSWCSSKNFNPVVGFISQSNNEEGCA